MIPLSRRAVLLGLGGTTVAGCVPRATIALVPGAASVGARREVFVGTTRAPDALGQPGSGRAESLGLARYEVSIPPGHRSGKFELPGREAPDPARHFVTTEAETYTSPAAFRTALGRAFRAAPGGKREAVVYVHGFNNTFADGVYRIAQIGHDLNAPAVSVHYSWPSAAHPLGYAYDRDSVLFARDGLAQLLAEVRAAGAAQVLLVAHSMGSLLVMETLRQIEIAQPGAAHRLVSATVLFSPDIDVELFRSQALRIGRLPDPFVIFTSRRDRALMLSARLTGGGERLGNLGDFDRLADLDVVVLDVTAFNDGAFNHFALARSPTLLSLFGNIRAVDAALGTDRAGRTGLLPGTVLTLQNATAIILSPVTGRAP